MTCRDIDWREELNVNIGNVLIVLCSNQYAIKDKSSSMVQEVVYGYANSHSSLSVDSYSRDETSQMVHTLKH